MIHRFWLWWEWRCIHVAAYLTSHTDDVKLAQDLTCQATKAKNKLDDYDMNVRMAR